MPFDYLAAAAVKQELQEKTVGGRVQGIIMPGPLTISMELYSPETGRTYLLLSAHPQYARVTLTGPAPSRDPSQRSPLLLLLRKYARGGTILDVSQPAHERVLEVSIAKRFWPDKRQEYHSEGDFRDSEAEEEGAPIVFVTLIAEIMGRLSNIVLVGEDGAVMDSIKRVPPGINRYRVTLPNHRYVPPPPQQKRDPLKASINGLALELGKVVEHDVGSRDAPAWQGLVSGFLGVSPTLAREVVFRALGDVNVPAESAAHDPAGLALILHEMEGLFGLEQTRAWQPCVAWREDAREANAGNQPLDFAPYALTHLEGGAQLIRYGSISEAIDAYFAGAQNLARHGALKEQVRAAIEELYRRAERRLRSLREEWQRAQALEELRRKGEFILAYMHTLQPAQTELAVPEENLTIQLDPALSPIQNAQAYFKEYRKARAAQQGLPDRIAEAEMHIRYFEEFLTSLDLANTYDEIRAVQAELGKARTLSTAEAAKEQPKGKGAKQQSKERLPQPLRLKADSGATLLVGRTASQNDTATFRLAGPEDLWFHARNVPGAHVILRAQVGIAPGDIEEAASVAAAYSKARTEAQVDVVYTERKFVRKVPGAPPGFVTYKNERVVRVAPAARQ